MSDKKKQSLLIGALTSSFGIFISKALGLLYYSPLSSLAGESNMGFYATAYTYYDQLLKISSAGIPFAIAALVARYAAKEDYKTVLLVKKLGVSLVMGLSFIVALVFLFVASPLASFLLGANTPAKDIAILRNVFYILFIAVITVPYLSAIRGYYQGLKRLDLYASSQVLEQFVRVFCILFFGFLFVKIIKLDSIWAIYAAIAAAGVAAIVAIIFFAIMTKKDDKHVNEMAKAQEGDVSITKKSLFIELISMGIPYVIISFLGSAAPLVNTTFISYATKIGMDYQSSQLSYSILQANCNKLSSIPQVLTLGFSSGLVPYLTESYEKKDVDKLSSQISQILDTVMFILIPILVIFVLFAKDIYFIMYGNNNLELGANLFAVSNLVTLTDTVAPILSSVMITLRMRRSAIITLIFSFIVKLATFFPCVSLFGTYGMIYSTSLCSIAVIAVYLWILRKRFGLEFKTTLKRLLMIVISSAIMVIPPFVIHHFLHFSYESRLMDIVIMAALGIMMLAIYYFVTVSFTLPQQIFGIEKPSIKKLLKRFRG